MSKDREGALSERSIPNISFSSFSNNLTNLLTVIGLLPFVVAFSEVMVYGRIALALCLAIFAASICYSAITETYRIEGAAGLRTEGRGRGLSRPSRHGPGGLMQNDDAGRAT